MAPENGRCPNPPLTHTLLSPPNLQTLQKLDAQSVPCPAQCAHISIRLSPGTQCLPDAVRCLCPSVAALSPPLQMRKVVRSLTLSHTGCGQTAAQLLLCAVARCILAARLPHGSGRCIYQGPSACARAARVAASHQRRGTSALSPWDPVSVPAEALRETGKAAGNSRWQRRRRGLRPPFAACGSGEDGKLRLQV